MLESIIQKETQNGELLVAILLSIARGEVTNNPMDRMEAIRTLARLGWGANP